MISEVFAFHFVFNDRFVQTARDMSVKRFRKCRPTSLAVIFLLAVSVFVVLYMRIDKMLANIMSTVVIGLEGETEVSETFRQRKVGIEM